MAAAKGKTGSNKLKIAVIPGDGIGNEVVPEGIRVLEAVGAPLRPRLHVGHTSTGRCERFAKTGAMMPADGLEQIAKHDAIYLGAVGWPGVPDHVSLWGLLIPIRRGFQQYVNLRPVRLFEGLKSPLADRKPGDIDYWIVRENNEGEYSSIGGRMYEGTEHGGGHPAGGVHQEGLRPRHALRLRAGHDAQAQGGGLRHQVERHLHLDALLGRALRRHRQGVPAGQDQPVPHRHPDRAPRAQPALVRRDRRLQPVRRHPLRPRPRHHRHHRHRARRQHQPRARVPLHVRAGARQRARHRRQGHRQSDRPDLVGRHDAGAPGAQGGGRRHRHGHREAVRRDRRAHRATWAARPPAASWATRWWSWWRG